MKLSVRHSLIAIALLGAITCVVSSYALSRLINTTNNQRVERARELVVQQLEVIRSTDGVLGVSYPTLLGTRGGVIEGPVENVHPSFDPATLAMLNEAIAKSAAQNGSSYVVQSPADDTTMLVGAAKTSRGAIAWTTYPVVVPPWIHAWRLLGWTLGLAGLALVVASIHLAVSVQRGANALKNTLVSLGRDLRAPVPRPALRELRVVADGIASLAKDLSESQKEQSRLSRELAERDRLAALGRVAAGVAHEVRNPLASIKLRLDLAKLEAGASAPALVSELTSASEEISRLDRIVADLLTVAGRRTGPRMPTDLGALASQRTLVVEPLAKERGVTIAVKGRAEAPVDADAVGRVLDNLLRNAVEASAPKDVVEVSVASDDSEAKVVISDHGTGVSPDRAHELFEPFFTTKPQGTGLGLAVSRAIATAHGGTLVYRREEQATVFELTLPRLAAEARA